MKITTKILMACLPCIVTGALIAASTGERAVSKPNASAMSKAKSALNKLPLSFEPNRGQTDPRVQFLSRGPGYTVFFTKDETVMSLQDTKSSNAVVRMKFVGGTNSATPHPIDALPGTTNYLIGNDSSKWHTGIAEYTKLRYENVYPGIDVVYTGDQKQLRYDFIVKPGASASAIQMAFEGADNVSVTKEGNLALTIDGKTLVTTKPFTYQEDAGAKKEVASHFVVNNGRVTFELAKYDTTKDLVIDPSVVFVTYLGGILNDSVNGVAIVNPTLTISSSPSAYFVTGTTTSPNFPTTAGVLPNLPGGLSGNTQTGVNDVFVSKISFNGGQILWSTYLGGNSQDTGTAIAVDAVSSPAKGGGAVDCTIAGCPVIAGQTFSANFPVAGPFQLPSLLGTNDAYAAKLAPDGKSLVWSTYLGGISNDFATGVVVDLAGNTFVGGYTDSPYFICPGNSIPPIGTNQCTNSNHTSPTNSADAFVAKIPVNYSGATSLVNNVALYGGFGEEFARAIAYNPTSNMVYLGGDTTTGSQNFIAPNNVNLPGISNNTANTGLPGIGPNARGGFVVAFDATTFARTWASYVAVSPSGSTGFETITGIASEGGCSVANCGGTGNIGHIYITGDTTSTVTSANIAKNVPGVGCTSPLAASSLNNPSTSLIGPNGTPVVIAGGVTVPAGCVTALITQAPYDTNQAVTTGCPFPLPLNFVPTATCNLSAYVAILDGALLTAPGGNPAPVGNQIEYWAYYSSANASTLSNALAIDSNPTTLASVYSLGTYQQMYITGSSQLTSTEPVACVAGGAPQAVNCLPTTKTTANPAASTFVNPSEIFTPYNVGTTSGGGVGGYSPFPSGATAPGTTGTGIVNQIDAYVARFNPNGLAASSYGGQGSAISGVTGLMGYGTNQVVAPNDHSFLIHTPQLNFAEFIYANVASDNNSTPNTVGNAIAVDPTRAALVGGATNVSNSNSGKGCVPANSCNFATTNNLSGTNAGGTDGWVSVLFFNDILTNASSQASANPFLQPGFPLLTSNANAQGGCAAAGNCSYIQTTPAPFGPTFDFALSDPSTQTQTFQVIFTGQTAGQLAAQTPWWVPLDPRGGANPPTLDNNLPGSGIAYYVPCQNPSATFVSLNPPGAASTGYYNNAYPAPGNPYGPMTCAFPDPTHLYEKLPMLYSGYPGLTAAQANGNLVTPGWLIVSQDINPGVVRLQLDRRAAAGLLEGTYVAQFLVTTLDSQQGLPGHPAQWPPCGPQSSLSPYQGTVSGCPASTPLPADNISTLVTVRLVVRPTLFLSRNSGVLTGITSSLAANPLVGPGPTTGTIYSVQQGTAQVPDWYYTGTNNDSSAWPAGAFGLGTIFAAGNNGVNSGPPTCVATNSFAGSSVANVNPLVPQLGDPANPKATNVSVPCPVSATAPDVGAGFGYGAAAYLGNGPGDLSGGGIGATPNMTFLYDAGTVLTIIPNALSQCNHNPADITNALPNECNLSIEQNLAPTRPDQPAGVQTFNAEFQGGQDPLTQRNDATVHDYYVSAEGPATISVAAINCTNWNATTHLNSVGNWLGVQMGGVSLNAAGAPTPTAYTPICTDLTASTIGTVRAPATGCAAGCTYKTGATIGDDGALPGAVGGQKIVLDFVTKAYTGGCSAQAASPTTGSTTCTTASGVGPRAALNGIPTGLYTADVYVWSTRAKNSVPGYCLGASMPAASATTGADPIPLCATSTGAASSANPNPEVLVSGQQTFKVTLFVFDTTQVIQITPNTCPVGGITTSTTEFATVANSENLFTGNITPPYGPGSIPNYGNFGPNGSSLVVWSLLPFQTTGTSITGCFSPGQICPATNGNPNGGLNVNFPVALPNGVSVNAQTLAQYNACALPTGKFGATVIDGSSVPGIGSLTQTGPLSQTTFVPASNGTNNQVTLYACRPTVAPAWLNSAIYPGNAVTAPGSPEPYANGNGPFGGPNATAVTSIDTTVAANGGKGPVPSVSGLTCPLAANTVNPPTGGTAVPSKFGVFRNGNSFLLDSNGSDAYEAGPDKFISTFFTPPGPIVAQPGDVAVAGDWTGNGTSKIGIYRPSTGTWYLDANNNGIFDAGDYTYQFGGIAGDIPVVGDWMASGKTCIGIARTGGFWLLDLNCNGTFDNTPTDAFFPFGGLTGDVPVVGNWVLGQGTRVGVVRKYAPGGVPQGNPFLWVLDGNAANAGNSPANHSVATAANLAPFAYGGLAGDVYVSGDWIGAGTSRAGIYRSGSWILDLGNVPVNHTYDTFFQFGGLATDSPIVGKW